MLCPTEKGDELGKQGPVAQDLKAQDAEAGTGLRKETRTSEGPALGKLGPRPGPVTRPLWKDL